MKEYLEKIRRGSVNPNFMRRYQEFFEVNPDMEYLNTGEQTRQFYGAPIIPPVMTLEEEPEIDSVLRDNRRIFLHCDKGIAACGRI